MGKHDKLTEDSYSEARIQELENQLKERDKQLAFDAETIKKLQIQCSRMSKWASEIEANAKEALAKEKEETEKWKAKCLGLVEAYVV